MSLNTVNELFSRMRSVRSCSTAENVGKSWLSRDILCRTFGTGEKTCLAVGGFSAGDIAQASFLVDLVGDIDGSLETNSRILDFNVPALCSGKTVRIIPAMNPDGLVLRNSGIFPDNPFYGRVMKIAKGNAVGAWEANIRGVQLDGNFNHRWIERKLGERSSAIFTNAPKGYFGEFPESELETSSLCAYSRKFGPESVIEVRRGEETVITPYPNAVEEAKLIQAYTGVKVSEDPSLFRGSFSGWAAEAFGGKSVIFTMGKNTSPEILKSAFLTFFAL